MGCGAYWCPPGHVAEEMRAVLFNEEFVGWFKEVIFAVYPATTFSKRLSKRWNLEPLQGGSSACFSLH
jgi:hypothetical protein